MSRSAPLKTVEHHYQTALLGLVSSGYSQNPIMANYREYGFQGVLSKPYQIQTLGEALHEAMVTPAPASP